MEEESNEILFGGIEAGGTKFICAVGSGPGELRAEARIPTTTPEETLKEVVSFFRGHMPLAAVGIGTFGPVDPDPDSPTFGFITNTPKPGWAHTDFAGVIRRELGIPVGFDTDVNAAALGEHRWGAAQGLDVFLYLTVGTGIGGGAMVGGRILHGLRHPEMGHIRLPHDLKSDPFPGSCPFHGDCFEGLASGPALAGRWGQPAETLPEGHPAWELEAHYIALALANYTFILSPERIILGGGVMSNLFLFGMIRRDFRRFLNRYIEAPEVDQGLEEYIVPPGLGNRSGVSGALALAQMAYGS